ncbi:MAG TPA: hypothetical protein VHP36_07145, partial [Chitinispirillaceae bacterium]|nr:hypothetical protein [Chitinispirillaceae bacterium]
MNNYFYSIIFVLSATFSLYSQTYNILVVQPKGSDYKKIELGLRSELNKTISIKSMVSKSETEITGSLNTDSPDLVVLMGIETIKAWKKIQQKNQNRYQIPSIMIDNEFSGINLTDISNSCSITYETKLKQYVNRFVHHTGKNPLNIGIVYSQKCSNLIQSYQSEASELGVNLHAKSVVISDPENSIKTIVNNFIEHYKVDFMIILDDNDVINNQNINTIWVSLLTPLKFPVAVPSDYFFEIEPRIGSFSIQPFYKEIGRVVASVINEASSNNWVIKQKSIYTDKSIFYYRNENGSISKKNQIENPIAVVYYPKTISTPVEEAVIAQHTPEPEVSSEALQQVASTLMNETNT